LTLACSGLVVGYWVAALNDGAAGKHAPPAAKVAAVVTVAWFGLWFGLQLTITWFNWPKCLVPPGQRGERGAVAEWKLTRSRRRHR
jgi:hypothetical protein